jgi:hypothetical protein
LGVPERRAAAECLIEAENSEHLEVAENGLEYASQDPCTQGFGAPRNSARGAVQISPDEALTDEQADDQEHERQLDEPGNGAARTFYQDTLDL